MRQRGAITVFLACIFLSIILVVVTMIDGAFLYTGYTQSERAVSSASYALLSEYYEPLKEEFGLFAYNEEVISTEKVKGYVEAQLRPYDYIERQDQMSLYNYQTQYLEGKAGGGIVYGDELEGQILEYMKYRGPLSTLDPFLSKFESVKKVSKTTKVVQKKTKSVDKKVGSLQKSYQKLIKYVEGVDKEKVYSKPFVKSLATDYNKYVSDVPEPTLKNKLRDQVYDQGQTDQYLADVQVVFEAVLDIKVFEAIIKSFEERISYLESAVSKIKSIDSRIENREASISGKYDSISDKKDVIAKEEEKEKPSKSKISLLKRQIQGLKDSIRDLDEQIEDLDDEREGEENKLKRNPQIGKGYDEVIKEVNKRQQDAEDYKHRIRLREGQMSQYGPGPSPTYIEIIQSLQSRYDVMYSRYKDVKESNEEAFKMIDVIKVESKEILNNIESLREDMREKESDYEPRLVEQMERDFKELEKTLYTESEDEGSKTSLKRMERILNKNGQSLSYFMQQFKIANPLTFFHDMEAYVVVDGEDSHLDLHRNKAQLERLQLIQTSSGKLHRDYEIEISFKYGELAKEDGKGFLDQINQLIRNRSENTEEQPQQNESIMDLTKKADIEGSLNEKDDSTYQVGNRHKGNFILDRQGSSFLYLPYEGSSVELPAMREIDEEGDFSDSLFSSLDGFDAAKTFEDIRNNFYINEYVLDKFRNITDIRGDEAEILKNMFNHQVEYILMGNEKDRTNLYLVGTQILLMRTALNFLHIMTDASKMKTITAIAEATVGWLLPGIAGFVMKLVLMAAWSTAESFVDLVELQRGEEVSFLKTRTTWRLSLTGLVDFTVEEAANGATNLALSTVDNMKAKVDVYVKSYIDKVDRNGENSVEDLENLMEEATEEIMSQAHTSLNELDYQVEQYIQDALNSRQSHTYLSEELQQKLDEVLEAKQEELMDQTNGNMDELRDALIQQAGDAIRKEKDKIIEYAKGRTNGCIKEMADQVTNATKEAIDGVKKKARAKLRDKVKKYEKNAVSLGKDKRSITTTIKFSYEDYLRLFLFMQDKEKKLGRVKNLIQMKMETVYDENFRLKDYYTEVKVSGSIYRQYLFIDKISDLINNKLITYKVSASSSY